jgi:hypothetical protein
VSPASVGAQGGRVVVTAKVKHASTCRLSLASTTSLHLTYPQASSGGCHSGKFAAAITFGPNGQPVAEQASFKLVATAGSKSATKRFTISEAAVVVPTTTTTTVPATTTTVPAPAALIGLPTPLTATSSSSADWAGYTLQGGPYTALSGTFTVPTTGTTPGCTAYLQEWVGVDYADNADLFRGGVKISEVNPSTGKCQSGHEFVSAFYEVEPGGTVVSIPVTVSPGDSVTVELWQVATGDWAVELTDTTTGQWYEASVSYSGPGGSAEWLLSAPVDPADCGAGVAPTVTRGICQVLPFTPVKFSNLLEAGTLGSVSQLNMDQPSASVSTSAESTNSFTLGYTS